MRYRNLIPYMIGAGLLLLVLPISQEYLIRLVDGFTGADLATQMRFGEYRDAVSLIQRYPVFGVGFAGSPDIDLYLGVAILESRWTYTRGNVSNWNYCVEVLHPLAAA